MPVGVGEDSVQGLPGGVHEALPAHQQLRSLWSTMEKRASSPLTMEAGLGKPAESGSVRRCYFEAVKGLLG